MNPASLTKEIANAIGRDDDGDPEPYLGYRYGAWNCRTFGQTPRSFQVSFRGSARGSRPYFYNHAVLEIDYWLRPIKASSLSNYFAPLSWPSSKLGTRLGALPIHPPFLICVERYARSPRLAELCLAAFCAADCRPPPTAIVERTPRGALLMAATDETFSIENPAPSRRRAQTFSPLSVPSRLCPGRPMRRPNEEPRLLDARGS